MRTKRPATVSSKATQVLHPQVGERAGERTLTGLAPDGTAGHSGIAFHAAPTQLLPIITLDEQDVTDSAAYEQLYAENALLRSERDSLRSSVERLQKELTAVSELLAQQQREMELLLPWLPTPSDEK